MAKRVAVDGVGDVEFPDEMSDEQIVAAIESDILPRQRQIASKVARARVPTRTLDAAGLSGTEVKRRAAAGEPIVQEGPNSRPPTAREALTAGAGDVAGGLARGLGMLVTLPADIANLVVRNAGSPYIPPAGRPLLPLTQLANEAADDFRDTTKRVLGGVPPEANVNEYAAAANDLAGQLAIPIPEIAAGRAALTTSRAGMEAAEAALRREASPQNIARIEREIEVLSRKKGIRALNRQMDLENQLHGFRQQAAALVDDAAPPAVASVADDATEAAVRSETGQPVRLYRAEPVDPAVDLPSHDLTSTPDVDAAGRAEVRGSWYTKDRSQAIGYKDDIQGLGHDAQIRTVDVPADQVDSYLAAKHPSASNYATDLEKDYFLPPEARAGSAVERTATANLREPFYADLGRELQNAPATLTDDELTALVDRSAKQHGVDLPSVEAGRPRVFYRAIPDVPGGTVDRGSGLLDPNTWTQPGRPGRGLPFSYGGKTPQMARIIDPYGAWQDTADVMTGKGSPRWAEAVNHEPVRIRLLHEGEYPSSELYRQVATEADDGVVVPQRTYIVEPPATTANLADDLEAQIGQLEDRAAKLFQQADNASDAATRVQLETEAYALADESDALLKQRDEALLVQQAGEAQAAARVPKTGGVTAPPLPPEPDFVAAELQRGRDRAARAGAAVDDGATTESVIPQIDTERARTVAARIRNGEVGSGPAPRNIGPRPSAVEPAAADVPPSGAVPLTDQTGPAPYQFKTSNKNAVVDAERAERGLPPMMNVERQSNQSAWDAAMRVIDENPQVQDELIAELSVQPRALTATENSMLLHRRVDIRNEHEKALRRWKEAFDAGDVELAAKESERVRNWNGKLADLEDITKATGAESGRSLQARKMMANEDFSLAEMELRATEAKGRNLTPDERIQLIAAQKKIVDLERKLEAAEAGREVKEAAAQTTEAMRDVGRAGGASRKQARAGSGAAGATEETITGRIKAKIEKGDGKSITPLVQQLARKLWERGVREQQAMIDGLHDALRAIDPAFTRDQTQRAFSGYGDFKPLSKEAIDVGLRDLKGQTQQVLKLESLEAGKPLEKTGMERRAPSDAERRLIKQVNELKRKYGVVTTDPATQLKSALQSRKTYYEHRITDLKHEIETRQRIVRTKSASPRDAELDAMIAEKDALQVEHDAIFPKQEITDEQRLKQAINVADRSRAQWEARLADAERGVFNRRAPGRKVTSPELEKIRAETAAIREHVEELRDLANPKRTPEERALKSLKTRMANQTLDYRRRLADGDFVPRERRVTPLDAEAAQLKAERDAAKQAFQTGLEKDRWAKASVFDKTKARIGGVYDLLRTVMATGEASFVLRQGKMSFLEALTSPRRMAAVARSIRDGVRAMRSPIAQHIVEQQMISDPLYAQALQHKLYVPEHGARLSRQEEFAMGRYSDSLPIVGAFNRAGESYLKTLRFENYKIMVKSMTETGTVTAEEGRIIAAHINEQTGRGGLGVAEPAAVALNRVMFSPRYLASRVQVASGHQLWSGKWAGTGRAMKAVAGSYARMLIGGAVYYTTLMAFFNRDGEARLGFDFRSSDGGKIKKGDTRLDPMAGIAQVMTFGQRTIMGEALDADGEVVPIVGEDVPYGRDEWIGYAARFARSKAHPALGMGIDLVPGFGRRLAQGEPLLKGKNIVGEEATLTSKLSESGPMTYYDIYEALREQDVPDGVAMSMLAWLGEGMQTYGEHTDMLREERAAKRAASK